MYRAYKDISQKEMAKVIGITQQALSRIENGNSTNLITAKKIADYFGVGIDDIFLSKNTIINSKTKLDWWQYTIINRKKNDRNNGKKWNYTY